MGQALRIATRLGGSEAFLDDLFGARRGTDARHGFIADSAAHTIAQCRLAQRLASLRYFDGVIASRSLRFELQLGDAHHDFVALLFRGRSPAPGHD